MQVQLMMSVDECLTSTARTERMFEKDDATCALFSENLPDARSATAHPALDDSNPSGMQYGRIARASHNIIAIQYMHESSPANKIQTVVK